MGKKTSGEVKYGVKSKMAQSSLCQIFKGNVNTGSYLISNQNFINQ